MFAVICLPDFELQAVLRHEPELRSQAVALIDGTPTNMAKVLVLQCSEKAQVSSVCPGLTAPQAQARCRELLLKPRSLSAEKSATEILLQTAYAFSPNIEHTAPGVCTIDLRGLDFSEPPGKSMPRRGEDTAPYQLSVDQQSFGFFSVAEPRASFSPEENNALLREWAGKIIIAFQQLSLAARVGIARTPNIALLAARWARPALIVDHVETFFEALPLIALEPTAGLLDILQRWGIHTTGAFLKLGKGALADRLGAEALELFERTSTDTIRPLTIVLPPDTFEEQTDFETHIETIEPLLFVLRRFVEQLATRIALTYRVVAELQLKLTLESGGPYEHTFKVPAPTANVETLFRMLHTHLESLRTDAPVLSLRLAGIPVCAQGQQFGLFESALRDLNHFHETLARLTALLGTDRVGTPVAEATHRPDAFRMQTPAFGNGTVEIRNRKSEIRNPSGLCLRRFRSPIHADVELRDGRPQFISTLLMSARIKRVRGPWCISGTWWDERRWSRQEWDVETEKGEMYRVRNVNGDWVLEGIYD